MRRSCFRVSFTMYSRITKNWSRNSRKSLNKQRTTNKNCGARRKSLCSWVTPRTASDSSWNSPFWPIPTKRLEAGSTATKTSLPMRLNWWQILYPNLRIQIRISYGKTTYFSSNGAFSWRPFQFNLKRVAKTDLAWFKWLLGCSWLSTTESRQRTAQTQKENSWRSCRLSTSL